MTGEPGTLEAVADAVLNYSLSAQVNWDRIADDVLQHKIALTLRPDQVLGFLQLIQRLNHGSKWELHAAVKQWALENWSSLLPVMHLEAARLFGLRESGSLDRFELLLNDWPRLKTDEALRATLVASVDEAPAYLRRLRLLSGDEQTAHQVMVELGSPTGRLSRRHELAELIAAWSADTLWGRFNALLWRPAQQSPEAPADNVEQAVNLLQEFGVAATRRNSYCITDMSQETRASWRHDLQTVAGTDPALRHCITEALFWHGAIEQDRAVLFAVMALHAHEQGRGLVGLLEHPVLLVRRRARAVLDTLDNVPDIVPLWLEAQATPAALPRHSGHSPSRTWIEDAYLEDLIEQTLNQAAIAAGEQIGRSLTSGEESHVVLLFERLSAAFARINTALADHAAQTEANQCLTFQLDYRVVGKAEEGGPGVGSAKFSADICLLFEAEEDGRRFARRVSLIQAKRLYRKGNEYYPIDREQLADLAGQTLASFLLLIGPEREGRCMPVIPARMMLDLIERREPAGQIAPAKAARLSRGLGTWLLEDVIGLWTGDWQEALLEKAEGGKDSAPFFLLQLSARRYRRVPGDSDGLPVHDPDQRP